MGDSSNFWFPGSRGKETIDNFFNNRLNEEPKSVGANRFCVIRLGKKKKA